MDREETIERLEGASAADRAAIALLLPQLSSAAPPDEAALAALLAQPGVEIFVARRHGTILGMLTLVRYALLTGSRFVIEDVVVDDAARGRGLGEALVRHAIAIARTEGARSIDLTSRPSREAANRLYVRLGFERRETNVYRFTLEA